MKIRFSSLMTSPLRAKAFARIITKPLVGLLVLVIILLACRVPCPAKGLVVDGDALFQYAQHEFDQKEWTSARAEFNRFVYFFGSDPRVPLAKFRIGQCMFHLSLFSEARDVFENIAKAGDALFVEAGLMLGQTFMALGRKNDARMCLESLLDRVDDPLIRDRIYFHLVWIYLSSGEEGKTRKYYSDLARDAVLTISSRYPILKEQLLKAISDIKEQKGKNPTLAGVLALIPGAGHLYCGRPRDGAVAFLFNSALFLAARHAFDNGNNALGGLIAFTGAGFYSGSIYGSISSAHKLNRQHRNRSIQKVRELLAPKLVLKRSFFHPGTICLALELSLGQD